MFSLSSHPTPCLSGNSPSANQKRGWWLCWRLLKLCNTRETYRNHPQTPPKRPQLHFEISRSHLASASWSSKSLSGKPTVSLLQKGLLQPDALSTVKQTQHILHSFIYFICTVKFKAAAYADKYVASCFYFNLNQPHSSCDYQNILP